MVTVDGFFAGPNGEIDWHRVDDEFNVFAIEQLNTAGGLIFGRVTYQLMADYWPTPSAIKDDPIVATRMNTIQKYVASQTLETVEWNNARLLKTNVVEEIIKLKQQPGGNLFIFGSASLAVTLNQQSLIDEYRLIINPILLGNGIPLFKGIHQPYHLKLVNTKTFQNGNVLLVYTPDRPGR
jgi:dihydrofolate reductase